MMVSSFRRPRYTVPDGQTFFSYDVFFFFFLYFEDLFMHAEPVNGTQRAELAGEPLDSY